MLPLAEPPCAPGPLSPHPLSKQAGKPATPRPGAQLIPWTRAPPRGRGSRRCLWRTLSPRPLPRGRRARAASASPRPRQRAADPVFARSCAANKPRGSAAAERPARGNRASSAVRPAPPPAASAGATLAASRLSCPRGPRALPAAPLPAPPTAWLPRGSSPPLAPAHPWLQPTPGSPPVAHPPAPPRGNPW